MMPTTQSEGAVSRRATLPINDVESTTAAPPTSGTALIAPSSFTSLVTALSQHWPEYLMEAGGLGVFMISACSFGAALQLPGSPVVQTIMNSTGRRVLMGIAMAATAIAIVYSPWGMQSGAHLNPSITLTFLRLRKIELWDAFFYVVFQFIGGIAGVFVAAALLGSRIADPAVNYVVTIPGPHGAAPAFAAEFLMAFVLMSAILHCSNHPKYSRYTGIFAGTLIALYISLAAPISGMSINPARTTSSAFGAQLWTAAWIYFTAPPLGMLASAELFLLLKGHGGVFCAKLHHHNDKRCIFRCRYAELQKPRSGLAAEITPF
jgi:aquaporin Z